MSDVIAAIATALAPSAIGIVRLSGDGAAAVAGRIFTPLSGQPLVDAPNRKLIGGALHDRQGRVIDQALAVYTRAPATYTGEDTVELQCHGSPVVLAAALEALLANGARQAGPGEFTKRAFLNGRMDLSQAEAVVDLIDAETVDAAANAAGQIGGAMARQVDPVYGQLVAILSHFHAVLDYPDEDIDAFSLPSYVGSLEGAIGDLEALLRTFDRGRVLKNGVKCAILGRPNAGKSSLLNALTGYERVIVTDIPGTTRDTVEAPIRLGGLTLRLLDTAGIRDTDDPIERMGVERALAAAKEADLAIFVCDGARPLDDSDRRALAAAQTAPRSLAIVNKSDLPQVVRPEDLPFDTVLSLSARTGQGLPDLEQAVEALFGGSTPCDGSILTNARQSGAVRRAVQSLHTALDALQLGLTPDAVLVDVEDALEALGEVTGKSMREEVTNDIFSRFCVGK
jgi:tRNA modification GTPase